MKPGNFSELAKQYQVSEQAVETLWQSLVSGNGSMASSATLSLVGLVNGWQAA